jgi:hypothetical protein
MSDPLRGISSHHSELRDLEAAIKRSVRAGLLFHEKTSIAASRWPFGTLAARSTLAVNDCAGPPHRTHGLPSVPNRPGRTHGDRWAPRSPDQRDVDDGTLYADGSEDGTREAPASEDGTRQTHGVLGPKGGGRGLRGPRRQACLYGTQLFCRNVSLRSRRPRFSGNFEIGSQMVSRGFLSQEAHFFAGKASVGAPSCRRTGPW